MSLVGLAGAHRVGKTSLAKAYAERNGLTFVETPVTKVFRSFGVEPSDPLTFEKRLEIQEELIKHLEPMYHRGAMMGGAVTDRTPVDLLGYTFANAHNDSVPDHLQERLAQYTEKCFDVINTHFSCVILVQPGIQIVPVDGKGAMSAAYIESLNYLMRGVMDDDRVQIPAFSIRRSKAMLDLEARVGAVELCMRKSMEGDEKRLKDFRGENRQLN